MGTDAVSVAAVLLALNENAAKRVEEINGFGSVLNQDDSDTEHESEGPMLDLFYDVSGNLAFLQITNMTAIEFSIIWDELCNCIAALWSTVRGNRCMYGGKDVFFMFPPIMRHLGQWDILEHVFGLKPPTFETIAVSRLQTMS